jgi:hypothetical protein
MCIRGRGGNAGLIDANDRQGNCNWESREMKMHTSQPCAQAGPAACGVRPLSSTLDLLGG